MALSIERLWRSAKVERVYLNTYQSIGELITNVDDYIDFYNYRIFHQILKILTMKIKKICQQISFGL
ncbi:hypothetical protein BSPLISOX_1767 [uncultured Gammaproteobacteria bacterium]|jgi:hypothetical protein|nr:hypothetical protein [uncultured Gammaproteobacteria bacterium]CAC9459834.1 hypothetical protein [uncultured Gammaproteobacteria bacterium]VVH66001.1 hypothetical protein BSPLISOX_1767 [uncultured Gammaproteobacteria bacterium]